ncbi:glycosyl transferase group 1 [Desulfocucumis palustris]|uniref:Glycosyl transferase group 1 n=2 Tax=Desulfocucumis palustris TaxID=1898651 RepID=A0A2L2XAX7_9FIRM|nr:glycosyl transferase group 1 [Desulfocucumis palustris]
MGGGVGNVISGIASSRDNSVIHQIILLEQPVHRKFLNIALAAGVKVVIQPGGRLLYDLIKNSDITIIHWWNHPKTAKLLRYFPAIPARVVLWTHVSCLTAPALHPRMLLISSMVWFTSPASYEAEEFLALPPGVVQEKTGVVHGCAGFDHLPGVEPEEHAGFNIGYLGYVDFSKLHPDFILFCKEVGIPGAKFILAGDAPAKDILTKQARKQGIKNEFAYLGHVENIYQVLMGFDVFGYPLLPGHTGTTENALLEAMAAKVPPVVLNQLAEKHIVRDGETGFLVSGRQEYGEAIRYLYNNPGKRREMGISARDYVLGKYSKSKILQSFYAGVEIVMKQPKKRICFKDIMGKTPAQWFASCLGREGHRFARSLLAGVDGQTPEIKRLILNCSPLLKGENKSSVFHYAREFPGDPMLRTWADILRESSENDA